MGVQNGNDEGPPAVFGENHGEAGGPAGFRPSLVPQNSRRLRGEPALMLSRLRSNLRVPLSPVVRSFTLDPVENQITFCCFLPSCSLVSSSTKNPTVWMYLALHACCACVSTQVRELEPRTMYQIIHPCLQICAICPPSFVGRPLSVRHPSGRAVRV